MASVGYQEVTVTLSAVTFSRLQQTNPFNKDRAAESAIDVIRVALLTMYPPHTPEEWKDKSRFPSPTRTVLRFLYDIVCYLPRRLIGRTNALEDFADDAVDESAQLTLKIPVALIKWIEKIAQEQGSTLPEATVYAIEYGHRVSDSHGPEDARKVWRDIIQMIQKRLFSSFRN